MKATKILYLLLLWPMVTLGGGIDTFIPDKAYIYIPMLKQEQANYWPDHPRPEVLAGLAEHESCISLTSKRCWDPSSEFKTEKELGVGIFQTTKTRKFDTLAGMQKAFSKELKELSWSNIRQRPDLQMRIMLLMERTSFKRLYAIKDPLERLSFVDAEYNGGPSGVDKDRRLCGMSRSCDPQVWFGNTELTCSKGKKLLYGKRTACDINRNHVKEVILIRSPKYKKLMS